ncbi:MAG: mechanosensitive ion channel family protein [Eubacterium sp.]
MFLVLTSTSHQMQILDGYIEKIIDFGINVLIALVILFVGRAIISMLLKMTKKIFQKSSIEESVSKFLESLIKIGLYLILIIIICDKVGIKTTSFIAVLGSAGLTIGLALQGSLSNFAGGVLILIMKPFTIGDYIISQGNEGTVLNIDVFYTTLVTVDNQVIKIPNGTLSDSVLVNATAMEKRRTRIKVGVNYKDDIIKAKKVMQDIASNSEYVLQDEEVQTIVTSLADSTVDMELRAWVKTEDYWSAVFELNEQIKTEFEKAGIEIAFNQLDVHIKND